MERGTNFLLAEHVPGGSASREELCHLRSNILITEDVPKIESIALYDKRSSKGSQLG